MIASVERRKTPESEMPKLLEPQPENTLMLYERRYHNSTTLEIPRLSARKMVDPPILAILEDMNRLDFVEYTIYSCAGNAGPMWKHKNPVGEDYYDFLESCVAVVCKKGQENIAKTADFEEDLLALRVKSKVGSAEVTGRVVYGVAGKKLDKNLLEDSQTHWTIREYHIVFDKPSATIEALDKTWQAFHGVVKKYLRHAAT